MYFLSALFVWGFMPLLAQDKNSAEEVRNKAIYEALQKSRNTSKPKWIERGDSLILLENGKETRFLKSDLEQMAIPDALHNRSIPFGLIPYRHHIVNHSQEAYLLNGQYIKSLIGIDYQACKQAYQSKKQANRPQKARTAPQKLPYHGGEIWGEQGNCVEYGIKRTEENACYTFGGKNYATYTNYVCKDYQPQLLTLSDIQKLYAPEARLATSLFMIDGILLTSDLSHYRIDRDYIDTVLVCGRKDLHGLNPEEYFHMHFIQIHTKNFRHRPTLLKDAAGQELSLNLYDYASVNDDSKVYYLNGERIGSYIGIDIDSLARIPHSEGDLSIRRSTAPQNNGSKERIEIDSRTYQPELLSLKELLLKQAPDAEKWMNTALFYLNGIPLTQNLDRIKIDQNYVHTVRIFHPDEIDRYNGGTHDALRIVGIYTKDGWSIAQCQGKLFLSDSPILKGTL